MIKRWEASLIYLLITTVCILSFWAIFADDGAQERIDALGRELRASEAKAKSESWMIDQRLTALERGALKPITKKNSEADRRCFAALRKLHENRPAFYLEFQEVDIASMDDIDRAVWLNTLFNDYSHEGFFSKETDSYGDRPARRACRHIFTIPVSSDNAGERNEDFETECYKQLYEAQDSGEAQPFLHLIDIGGDELLGMGFTHDWNDYGDYDLPGSELNACVKFYPQVFFGHWIPMIRQ